MQQTYDLPLRLASIRQKAIARSLTCVVLMLALSLGGCAATLPSQPAPQKRFHALNPQRDAPPAPLTVEHALKIRRLVAAPSYASSELVYRLQGGDFATDYYNLFLSPPADQTAQALLQWLRNAQLFSAVQPSGSAVDARYLLEADVLKLYGDYTTTPPRAVAAVQAVLLEDDGLEYVIRMNRTFEAAAPAPPGEPPATAVVQAMEHALAQIFAELEAALVVSLRETP